MYNYKKFPFLVFINNAFFALISVIVAVVMIGTYYHYKHYTMDTKHSASGKLI